MVERGLKCSVVNCKFNKNLLCSAGSIEVNCDDRSIRASESEETCCDTFAPWYDEEM
ncbi:DUF1540 domain-containing protein [Dethiobacter alkaliphilus]|uniref:DUF1540 domain-containing protein n=1 Tax=Dethiobacter alkaliphilus AHT 1 TaxID=555088 RepID=C0GGL4_DETAL|nr:DUF1540 domain-containing protein [Dethiobacter alkaliphilus]EEG77455.1 protein of unknown function DUF1540 [Dethiobacter alkaliphilus AHT 1]